MSRAAPVVARVCLVAARVRIEELRPWLHVEGEPVDYRLIVSEPSTLLGCAGDAPADVVVIDGPSVADGRLRRAVFAQSRRCWGSFTTVLYLFNRLPSDEEVRDVDEWADDGILHGWQVGARLRRRVQAVALAPWRRAAAVRADAERLGPGRLTLVGGATRAPGGSE